MSKKQQNEPASFEQAIAELEQLVAQMEGGNLPLEACLAAYQRGSELARWCGAQLERIDERVKVLEGQLLQPYAGADGGEA